MNIAYSFLIAASLSMDNLAVCVSAGCSQRIIGRTRIIWQISLLFALAHFVMFTLGFEGGVLLHAGRTVGLCLAGSILVFIGGRMIQSAGKHAQPVQAKLLDSFRVKVLLALATSMDALLVGAGLALSAAFFWQTVLFLTICVFITSLCGFYLGRYLGQKVGPRIEIVGGLVLLGFGIKMLLQAISIW